MEANLNDVYSLLEAMHGRNGMILDVLESINRQFSKVEEFSVRDQLASVAMNGIMVGCSVAGNAEAVDPRVISDQAYKIADSMINKSKENKETCLRGFDRERMYPQTEKS